MCLSSIAGAVEYKAYQHLPLESQFVNIFSLDIKKEVNKVSIKSLISELLYCISQQAAVVAQWVEE
jgi:hypothetical protein